MRIMIKLLFFLFLHPFVGVCQDQSTTLKDAEKYYEDLHIRRDQFAKEFTADYMKKHGFPPGPELFFKKFDRIERNALVSRAYNKSNCINETINYLEERLGIWQHSKYGWLPDSTFTVLMDAFYDIAPEEAIDYCVDHWALNKMHIREMNHSWDGRRLENYPFVHFLFDNLDYPELIEVLLTHKGPEIKTEQNYLQLKHNPQSLSDLVIWSLRVRMGQEEFDEAVKFVQYYSTISKSDDLNQYFISQIETIADKARR